MSYKMYILFRSACDACANILQHKNTNKTLKHVKVLSNGSVHKIIVTSQGQRYKKYSHYAPLPAVGLFVLRLMPPIEWRRDRMFSTQEIAEEWHDTVIWYHHCFSWLWSNPLNLIHKRECVWSFGLQHGIRDGNVSLSVHHFDESISATYEFIITAFWLWWSSDISGL